MRKDVTAKMENVTQHNPVTHPLFLKGCGCDDVTDGMFGLSFSEDGACMWQFVVDAVAPRIVRITTFSWVDGSDYSQEVVSPQFIKDRCILFDAPDLFLSAASFWGGPGNKRNPLFVVGGK